MISDRQQQIIQAALSQYQPKMVGIFGSFARCENHAQSDLDLLVDFDYPIDLLDIIGLEQELSEKLGVKVDLVTLRSLHPLLREQVEQDLVRLVS